MSLLITHQVIQKSGIQFGTSGARGLVTQFSADVCAAFTHAFIESLAKFAPIKRIAIAIDNRPSSPDMARACIAALEQRNIDYVYYGVVPTPGLAYAAMQQGIPCIMVTGSHIPFDRNGLKFYTPEGEITKDDEQSIWHAQYEFASISQLPDVTVDGYAAQFYAERYTSLFAADLLAGKKIGIYEHSSAGRDIYASLFSSLGAEVISLERSDEFVPIDTEAVSETDKLKARTWSEVHKLDAIFSTDGDGDRPLVADEHGEWLRGDILGLLCAKAMKIDALAIPVSCNTVIDRCDQFKLVKRTKIGSPYVIAEFAHLANEYHSIAGFEANGGYLLGSDTEINGKVLKALPTRDAVLPFIMLLSDAKDSGIAALAKDWASRQAHSDRIQNFATENSRKIIAFGTAHAERLLGMLNVDNTTVTDIDVTDGLRLTLESGDIVHLRPSGNAPELRCYAESDNYAKAKSLVDNVLTHVISIDISLL